MSKAHFRTSGNIARLLGEQLVSNKFVALVELVKNCYDADAKEVSVHFKLTEHPKTGKRVPTLVVEDNGLGMTEGEILNGWLLLGTARKEREKKSPGGRRLLGAKGIGRFAFQRLASYSRVQTVAQPRKAGQKSAEFEFDIDWTQVVRPDSLLSDYVVNIKSRTVSDGRGAGTHIFLYDLADDWTEPDIERLKHEISVLVAPGFSGNFSVRFSHWKFAKEDIKLSASILRRATYSIKGRADGKGVIVANESGSKVSLNISSAKCGPFSFELYAYDWGRNKKDMRGTTKKLQNALREFHGIKIYRDSFRVKPYGDSGSDWLGLDRFRVSSVNRFSSEQMIGVVNITSEDNPLLVDQTNREGIIEGAAFKELKSILFELVQRLSKKNVAWHQEHSSKGTYAKKKRKAKKQGRKTGASDVDDFIDVSDKVIRELEESNADLRANASIGLSILGVGHDLLEEVKLARAQVREIQNNLHDREYVNESLRGLKTHIDVVHSFVELLEEFGHLENQEPAPIFADDVVRGFFKRYGPLLHRENSGLKYKIHLDADGVWS